MDRHRFTVRFALHNLKLDSHTYIHTYIHISHLHIFSAARRSSSADSAAFSRELMLSIRSGRMRGWQEKLRRLGSPYSTVALCYEVSIWYVYVFLYACIHSWRVKLLLTSINYFCMYVCMHVYLLIKLEVCAWIDVCMYVCIGASQH